MISYTLSLLKDLLGVIILTILICLSGCATYDTTLTNPSGQKLNCRSEGFGVIGSTVATVRFSQCVEKAKEKGYVATES